MKYLTLAICLLLQMSSFAQKDTVISDEYKISVIKKKINEMEEDKARLLKQVEAIDERLRMAYSKLAEYGDTMEIDSAKIEARAEHSYSAWYGGELDGQLTGDTSMNFRTFQYMVPSLHLVDDIHPYKKPEFEKVSYSLHIYKGVDIQHYDRLTEYPLPEHFKDKLWKLFPGDKLIFDKIKVTIEGETYSLKPIQIELVN